MRIVIATGGTGGHIFPALQTANVLKARGHDLFFVGSLGLGEEKVKAQGFFAIPIRARGLTGKTPVVLFKFISSMIYGFGRSMGALKQINPDKVIGFGGYGSFAVVLAARVLNIPTMIHEQNVVPGKANRLLAKIVKRIALSFPATSRYLNVQKTIWTGCPCHQVKPLVDRESLYQKFSLDPKHKTILVIGGSQGSHRLNKVFFEMISSLAKEQNIQAIHMTGKREYSLYKEKYQNSSLPVTLLEFISPIEEAYAISDVAIARAGAATVSELGSFAIPTVFVPYPLADGHQKYNAEVLSALGLAKIIEEKDLTSDQLKMSLKILLSSSLDRVAWQEKTRPLFKESPAEELASAVENL
jgi:UDP-N-acetylglucosamine--N-acetylmuramyl-(pentapeptide) pyrophosphoryl-undecaprenol N-acetylglucosamine transferase